MSYQFITEDNQADIRRFLELYEDPGYYDQQHLVTALSDLNIIKLLEGLLDE